jgi:hypothetical protein
MFWKWKSVSGCLPDPLIARVSVAMVRMSVTVVSVGQRCG